MSPPGPELPDYSDEFQSSNLSGGVQLLIPVYQFNCIGGIAEWRARVNLQQNVSETMEFQALRPVANDDYGVYKVIFHNEYTLDNVKGSSLTLPEHITGTNNFIIPVDPYDIVGIYVKNASKPLEVLFESAPSNGGVDVYYWEGLSHRRLLVGKSLVRYRMIATFMNKGWMKLMIHTGKYKTQLLMSQLGLMMKTVKTTRMKYMKRRMYSKSKFSIFVRIERSGNR